MAERIDGRVQFRAADAPMVTLDAAAHGYAVKRCGERRRRHHRCRRMLRWSLLRHEKCRVEETPTRLPMLQRMTARVRMTRTPSLVATKCVSATVRWRCS
ncbi:hypothetical protein FF100_27590 [Methylobacterium terricola]|uniref:Uncharacterized protein n=1 Tax=Methylobacterium terricola TaxID=2583531 RepID=A0A5C4L9D4_9HYPH|nr:hypothetical protein [Methylobacterium terricola]TNC09069.1 hypothetical protein FF100_27590 [Methylobacterium terricola]